MDLKESESVGVKEVRGQRKPLDTHRHTFFQLFVKRPTRGNSEEALPE
jgi:hypothetical protein